MSRMRIEFLVKSPDYQKLREEAEEKHGEGYEQAFDLSKVLSGEQELKIPITYRPWGIEMTDIAHFGKEDDEHTEIRTSSGAFSLKIDYDIFKQIYMTATATQVKTLNDFKIMPR